jgi:hypothetical protein
MRDRLCNYIHILPIGSLKQMYKCSDLFQRNAPVGTVPLTRLQYIVKQVHYIVCVNSGFHHLPEAVRHERDI